MGGVGDDSAREGALGSLRVIHGATPLAHRCPTYLIKCSFYPMRRRQRAFRSRVWSHTGDNDLITTTYHHTASGTSRESGTSRARLRESHRGASAKNVSSHLGNYGPPTKIIESIFTTLWNFYPTAVSWRLMDDDLGAIDELLRFAEKLDASMQTKTLREVRGELVRTSVFVSYAVGVLSLDLKILNRCWASHTDEVLQTLVDDMPEMLTTGWVGGGWSLSPDASASVAAAAELSNEDSIRLLELHAELATSDLGDLDVVSSLLARVKEQRGELCDRRDRLEHAIRKIQQLVQQHYATGAASVDDWLA